jgi:hypothetical protein
MDSKTMHPIIVEICLENKNQGFPRLNITKKYTIDSIYISADYAIIKRYNQLSITNKFEIKLLRVMSEGR